MQDQKNIFNQQVNKYRVDYWRTDEEAIVEKHFTNHKAKVLVLGCGAGRTLPHLRRKGYHIFAIDNASEMVKAAQEVMGGDKEVQIFEMDASDLQFDNDEFDYAFFPFHGIDCVYPDIYKVVSEVARVLKPDGCFIFSSHNKTYIKKILYLFDGNYAVYDGLRLYRTSPLDLYKLRMYFSEVRSVYRIELQNLNSLSWKDWVYRIIPVLSKSTYWICNKPVR